MIKQPAHVLILILLLAGTPFHAVSGLPLGEKQIAHFEKEVYRTLREILSHPGEETGGSVSIVLDGKTIRDTAIRSATLTFQGLSGNQLTGMREGGFDLDQLKKGEGIKVQARLAANAIQQLITREIGRLAPEKRIFDKVTVFFQKGQVQVSGLVDFRKIPGNMLAFLSRDFSPFTATVKVLKDGDQIEIDIVEAVVNGQPMTPELRTQILGWLNPVWDFSLLPYPADLEQFEFSEEGITFNGHLFGRE